jgi:DNA helicase HerA-like ATPase
MSDDAILLGKADKPQRLSLRYANRHGLVAGATGTGKTVTLQVLAEGFSGLGVPVFVADVKGDLAGLGRPAETSPKLAERAAKAGLAGWAPAAAPVIFWDVFGAAGHPVRTTVSEMGPLLLSRLLELAEAQEGALNAAFRIADDEGLLLLDLKDLKAMLAFASERAAELSARYGNVARPTVGAIQRRLAVLESQGGDLLFGEPALELADLMRLDERGRGYVSVLAADRLIQSPKVYATFLLWLLSELFEELPEVGDEPAPRLVFFFDEAHLLFADAPKALVQQVEQVVRLIRSKGVGVYFVTQNPLDLPEAVLGQLANRFQHALRAFTPKDQKQVKAAAETMPANPRLNAAEALTRLAVGEALVSTLEGEGTPGMVRRTLIRPPASRIGGIAAEERRAAMGLSPVGGKYDAAIDRESAYERLAGRATAAPAAVPRAGGPWARASPAPAAQGRRREGLGEAMAKSVVRSVGAAIGREIVRGLLGSILRRR